MNRLTNSGGGTAFTNWNSSFDSSVLSTGLSAGSRSNSESRDPSSLRPESEGPGDDGGGDGGGGGEESANQRAVRIWRGLFVERVEMEGVQREVRKGMEMIAKAMVIVWM